MNPFDLVLLVLMVLLAMGGALWGIVRIAASLVGFFLAFVLGIRFAGRGPEWFGGWIESDDWARLVAFFAIFLGTMVTAALVTLLARRFLRAIQLRWADRLAGALVGVIAALLIGAALAVPLTALPPADTPILEDSILAPYALRAADLVKELAPEGLKRSYREKRERLRKAWREGTAEEDDDGQDR